MYILFMYFYVYFFWEGEVVYWWYSHVKVCMNIEHAVENLQKLMSMPCCKRKRALTLVMLDVKDWPKVVFVKLLHNSWWFQKSSQLSLRLLDIEDTCTSSPWAGVSFKVQTVVVDLSLDVSSVQILASYLVLNFKFLSQYVPDMWVHGLQMVPKRQLIKVKESQR